MDFDKIMLATEIDANPADIEILEVLDVTICADSARSWWITYALHTDPTPEVHGATVFAPDPRHDANVLGIPRTVPIEMLAGIGRLRRRLADHKDSAA